MITGARIILCVANRRAVKAAVHGRLHACMRIFHHQAHGRQQAYHFGSLQKHLGSRLGVGDAVAIRHGIKIKNDAFILYGELPPFSWVFHRRMASMHWKPYPFLLD